jgi:hypothetical protein
MCIPNGTIDGLLTFNDFPLRILFSIVESKKKKQVVKLFSMMTRHHHFQQKKKINKCGTIILSSRQRDSHLTIRK